MCIYYKMFYLFLVYGFSNSMAGNTRYFPSLMFPRRPDFGSEGSQISLQSNLFPIVLNDTVVFHYRVIIVPDRKIKQINRFVY